MPLTAKQQEEMAKLEGHLKIAEEKYQRSSVFLKNAEESRQRLMDAEVTDPTDQRLVSVTDQVKTYEKYNKTNNDTVMRLKERLNEIKATLKPMGSPDQTPPSPATQQQQQHPPPMAPPPSSTKEEGQEDPQHTQGHTHR